MGLRPCSTVAIRQLGKHILRKRQFLKEKLKGDCADEPGY